MAHVVAQARRTGPDRHARAQTVTCDTRPPNALAGHLAITTSEPHGTLVAQLTQQFTALGSTSVHRITLCLCCGVLKTIVANGLSAVF